MGMHREETLSGGGVELLLEREVALRWKMSTRSLERWRARGIGPAYIRVGGSIRYRLADIQAYEDSRRHDNRAVNSSAQ